MSKVQMGSSVIKNVQYGIRKAIKSRKTSPLEPEQLLQFRGGIELLSQFHGGRELCMRQMVSQELATQGGTVDLAKFLRLLPKETRRTRRTLDTENARAGVLQCLEKLKQAGKKIEISDGNLLSNLDAATQARIIDLIG